MLFLSVDYGWNYHPIKNSECMELKENLNEQVRVMKPVAVER